MALPNQSVKFKVKFFCLTEWHVTLMQPFATSLTSLTFPMVLPSRRLNSIGCLLASFEMWKLVPLNWYRSVTSCYYSLTYCQKNGVTSFHISGVPTQSSWWASAGKAEAGMVHSVSGWMRGLQVKLWDPLRTRAIPERLWGVITTRRYTNPRFPLPLLTLFLQQYKDFTEKLYIQHNNR